METMHGKAAKETACPGDDGKERVGCTTDGQHDPWNPAYPPCDSGPPCHADIVAHIMSVKEWMKKTGAILAKSRATNIITLDRTPQWVNDAFFDILPRLVPILEKDSARPFIRFLNQNGRGMTWGYIITPETLNQLVVYNALKCAQVVLVGEDPELCGFRANPNCITQYGFFPLHRAAEMFSVDMIELLLCHGASANLRTAGDFVTEDLLPLHVAVENTCMHKYLEDSLNPYQEHLDCGQADINYVLKLLHILCLPEMKLFLDTTRLLAKHTDNLLVELDKYMKDGMIVHTAILLLAAQEQIRGVSSCMRSSTSKLDACQKNKSKMDGFGIITSLVVGNITSIKLEMYEKGVEMESLEAKRKLFDSIRDLVDVISEAGETLDSYIRSHPKAPYVVPHEEVFERVSLILKAYGFCSAGVDVDIGELCPYKNVLSLEELPHKLGEMSRIKAGMEVPCLQNGKAKVKKEPRGWDLKFARRSFFPYWRSVLTSRFPVKTCSLKEMKTDRISMLNKSTGKASAVMGGNWQQKVNYQPRRLFGTAALALLKALRKA